MVHQADDRDGDEEPRERNGYQNNGADRLHERAHKHANSIADDVVDEVDILAESVHYRTQGRRATGRVSGSVDTEIASYTYSKKEDGA